jgi:hypothetical protein
VTHFLTKKDLEQSGTTWTTKPLASVMCEWKDGSLVLVKGDSIRLAKPGLSVALLPKHVAVRDPYMLRRLNPGRQFWVSVDTFDPYHLILDIDRTNL